MINIGRCQSGDPGPFEALLSPFGKPGPRMKSPDYPVNGQVPMEYVPVTAIA